MPAKTGKQYLDRINQAGADIMMNGKKLKGKVSEHPAFQNVMQSQARLYDLQHETALQDTLTYLSPSSGERVGLSYMVPKTKEDLIKRRKMFKEWALQSHGMLGRSPDYMNTVLMAFGSASEVFGQYAENVKNFYEYCRENDVSLTHTFIQPQVNRSEIYFESDKEPIAARIVDKTKEGIIIQGARLLATQGATTDEILVFPSGMKLWNFNGENPYAYAFAIPNNTKGLSFICRESLYDGQSSFDRPLSSRFEEVDTLVVFDHVTIPWERIFVAGDANVANNIFPGSYFTEHTVHQVMTRQIVKTEFILGLIDRLIEMINIGEYDHVQEKLTEVVIALETMKAFQLAAEQNATANQWGVMIPDKKPILASMNYFPRIYPRLVEILQTLGASGLVMLPTEADFQSDVKKHLDKYLKAANANAEDRVKLFRLAWDTCMSGFATRETQYERYFFGDPVRLSGRIYREYDRKEYTNRIDDFIKLNKKV
ncbi:MAG TPA: 4-hydroxyphenylacetate 3-monooxygenase, oxygenase component [Bacillales bacterium]|nr:4-hydroxyphenylacetate 3-monooxygenase, oxygenase component [Bacillales bacterium]